MYVKDNNQNTSNYLKFLNNNCINYPNNQKNLFYVNTPETTHKIHKINTILFRILKVNKTLKFTITISMLGTNNTSLTNALYSKNELYTRNLFFYSSLITSKLLDYTNKNNFQILRITNMVLYLNLQRYNFIFNNVDKHINLNNFLITNVSQTFQEITEIKPDKAKKIFFKKKQVKTFTYFNEISKAYTYVDAQDADKNILEKDLFIKNIFNNTISDVFKDSSIVENKNAFSNKSLSFWKKSRNTNILDKLVLDNYILKKYSIRWIFQIQCYAANTVEVQTSPLDFNVSINFADPSNVNSSKTDFYKNIFLYNFISLFSKTTDINYSQKYTYFNHVPEFKDYFFKKNNPLSRDLIVLKFKNKNKFNNFFPLYCLSFKKFKKLILFSKKQQSPAYSAYYMYYLVNFLELICKKKIWIRMNTKKQISDDVYSKFTALFLKNRADQVNIGKHFFLIEFYEIIYLSFINRDIAFFAMWFKKVMEKIHLKKHRKMVKVVHSTIRNNLLFLELTGLKGFSMDVRGKLGTAGNSKKKHYAFTVGSIAPTTKSHGLNLYQTTVRTSTGVLGVTILMSY